MTFWQHAAAAAAGIGLFFLAVLGAALVGVLTFRGVRRLRRALARGKLILELDLSNPLSESASGEPWSRYLGSAPSSFREVLDALEHALNDVRVVGIVVRCSESSLGLAQSEELRGVLARWVEQEKEVIALADTFGEGAPGWLPFYVASAASRVVMQPSGDLNLAGLMSEQPFVRELLDRLGVLPRFQQRHEYKSVGEIFTRRDMSGPAKESMHKILDGVLNTLCQTVSEGRGVAREQVDTVVKDGPYSASAALEAGLVDALGYRHDVYEALRKKYGRKLKFRYVERYQQKLRARHRRGPTVALVVADGDIVRGASRLDLRSRSLSVGSDTVGGALRAARLDDDVRGVLLRINSRGGSYVASDSIWREVKALEEDGKPVVASFGDYAASGGYYIATAARAIVSSRMTLTGSIGVAGGKFVLRDAWQKLGIRFDGVTTHGSAKIYSANHDYDEAGQRWIEASFDRAYRDFVTKVGEARKMDADALDRLARGRVWTGAQAFEIGLVDEVGGLDVALDRLKREAQISGGITLRSFPAPRAPWAQLVGGDRDSSEDEGRSAGIVRRIATLGLVLLGRAGLLRALDDLTPGGVRLEAPSFFESSRASRRP